MRTPIALLSLALLALSSCCAPEPADPFYVNTGKTRAEWLGALAGRVGGGSVDRGPIDPSGVSEPLPQVQDRLPQPRIPLAPWLRAGAYAGEDYGPGAFYGTGTDPTVSR